MTELNKFGIPQYPKGHAGRLLVTLAAIDFIKKNNNTWATVSSVADLTGLSKGKVDDYVKALNREFGTKISKSGPEYTIDSWGVILNPAGVRRVLTEVITDIE